ncbi:response regulator receiver and ANTAR domain protein [Tsukamurella pulmonis]|uniref:Transcriptional regulatory protein PdtaR n=2 Tax=Tsukamurella pulmonis TaxID=47312 RepID=A0A1H1FNG2_9ACTN|nr:response regulator receiver and ANTAR domain protein [Tsukamurella pulmonis]SUP18700.1 Probable transcriptional regulatory protein pdtaR [Tsukamurella pulmonis]
MPDFRRPVTYPLMKDTEPTPHRVLVAEDEAIIRMDLTEMLREEGYDVVGEAENGQVALEKARDLQPDLVIMDVKMPVLNGLDAAQDIARERIAPVVMLTAFGQREFVEKAREAGAMAYLVKPFTKADLVPAIEIAISRFAELKALEKEVTTLSGQLETRKLVDRAKSILMQAHGVSEPEAFRWIQRTAMDRRTDMRTVAHLVIDTLGTPTDSAGAP